MAPPFFQGIGLACANTNFGGTGTSTCDNRVPRGTTPPVTPRTTATTEAPSHPSPPPPPVCPWHISHMAVSLQIVVLLWGRYCPHQHHYHPPLGDSSPMDDLTATEVPTYPTPEWDLSARLMLLSNDIPPRPRHQCPSDSCRQGNLYPLAHRLMAPANDIVINADPPARPMHFLTRNLGGPHLKRKQWGKLLQETTASEPMILCLREVRFRTGTAHMVYTARASPKYPPLFYADVSPNMILLVHDLPHLPPLESHQVRERILSMGTGPPGIYVAAMATGTPVHHAWSHPHPPPVDCGQAGSGHPRQSALPSGQAGSPTG